ncbi:MAG: hypothetical protein GY696_23725, partial [Gammaproteobacteria bacterium]|nr:hypothetical protein [Gammaproteobacteria bacterium]
MDNLLDEASRLHLIETDWGNVMPKVDIRTAENIAEDVAMDTTSAEDDVVVQVRKEQVVQIQNTIEEALEWLRNFEKDRDRMFPTNPDGGPTVLDTIIQLK